MGVDSGTVRSRLGPGVAFVALRLVVLAVAEAGVGPNNILKYERQIP